MKILLLTLLLFPFKLWSQGLLMNFKEVQDQIAQEELDQYLKDPKPEGVDGPFFESLLSTNQNNLQNICKEESKENKTHYEIVMIAQGNAQESEVEFLPGQKRQLSNENLKKLINITPRSNGSTLLTTEEVLSKANKFWNSGLINTSEETYDPHSALGQELFIEGLIQNAKASSLQEYELAGALSKIIQDVYKTEEEKLNALSALSLRLYRNYNDARNPGSNTSENNPSGVKLPSGDMSLGDLMNAAAVFDPLQGGVCNDISESVALVGEKLFPDKDVLTVMSGTHFGVIVADEKKNHIINSGKQMNLENRLFLTEKMSPTNLRISKVQDGALKEIAVVDTEMGQLTEAAFKTGKNLLKTDADISSLMTHFKKKNHEFTVGSGHLSDSNVLIVVAKYETASDKWNKHLGLGASVQDFKGSEQENKYQVHFRAGAERYFYRYMNEKTTIQASMGFRLNGMYTLNQEKIGGGPQSIDMSMGLDWTQKIEAQFGKHNPEGIQVKSTLEVEQTLGPNNWGALTGAFSNPKKTDYEAIFKNMSFHLNQINLKAEANKKFSEKMTGFTSLGYQGSNIGQRATILAGVDIKAPSGAQILIFTGYTNSELKGYLTQHSLIAAPTGVELGGKYKSKKGVEVSGSVKGLGREPAINGTLKIPILNNSGR